MKSLGTELSLGMHWCVHSFVRRLGEVVQADCAGIVCWDQNEARWGVCWECGYQGARTSLASLLETEPLQQWLNESEKSEASWGLVEIAGRNWPMFWAQVWYPAVVGRAVAAYRLILVRPRRFSGDATMADAAGMGALAGLWSAWAASEAPVRRRSSNQVPRDGERVGEGSPALQGLDGTVAWPMVFRDLVEVEGLHGHTGARRASVVEQVPECVLEEMGLTEVPWPCDVIGEDGRRACAREPGRERFERLAKLIPWRSAALEHGRAWPREAADGDFGELTGLQGLFLQELEPRRLEEKGLGTFFANAFWKEWLAPREGLWRREEVGQGEKLRWLRNCTNLAHYLLAGMPADEKAIEGLVWAVARYGHDVLGVEPRLEIASHLLHAARSEPALHVLRPFYRDHFFHAIEVCFLGHLLLETRLESGRRLMELVEDKMGVDSPQEVLREWYVAALFHDVGYSIEVLNGARSMLEFFRCSPKLKRLVAAIDQALDTLSGEFLGDGWEGYRGARDPGRDHGTVAADHLRGLVKQIQKNRNEASEHSAGRRAIALHNQPGLDIDFATDPLAVLLVLCDTIQEWNRPHLRFSTAPAGILSWMLQGGAPGPEGDNTGPLEYVKVNLERVGGGFCMKPPSSLEFDMHYDERVNRNAGVFNLWLDSCANLQRLKINDLNFDVTLRYTTPSFVNSQRIREPQMHRLKMAAEETHMSFLADWFPGLEANGPVRYGVDDTGHEVLTVDLKKLCAKRPITASMDAFRERLARWRDYNEDRDFAGDYAQVVLGQE